MKVRNLTLMLSALALAAASFAANADILFGNLGTTTPPVSVGGHAVTPFSQAPQAAIADGTTGITAIPGNPNPGTLSLDPGAMKLTVGTSWWAGQSNPWGHNYTGVVYYVQEDVATLTLPANTQAFYFYVQPNSGGTWAITATTNSGTTSGPIPVTSWFSEGAANGFAFYSTAGESIASITISAQSGSSGMAIGEFGISSGATCASEGYTGTKLTWCKNICEMGYTGATLNMWIRRWVDRYHDLPYCAAEPQPALQ